MTEDDEMKELKEVIWGVYPKILKSIFKELRKMYSDSNAVLIGNYYGKLFETLMEHGLERKEAFMLLLLRKAEIEKLFGGIAKDIQTSAGEVSKS